MKYVFIRAAQREYKRSYMENDFMRRGVFCGNGMGKADAGGRLRCFSTRFGEEVENTVKKYGEVRADDKCNDRSHPNCLA